VKELELELILVLADALVIEDDDSDQFSALECTVEPSAPVEAVTQDRRGFLCFARWPTGRKRLGIRGSEHQSSVLKAIDVVCHFTAIDIPDMLDFFPE